MNSSTSFSLSPTVSYILSSLTSLTILSNSFSVKSIVSEVYGIPIIRPVGLCPKHFITTSSSVKVRTPSSTVL